MYHILREVLMEHIKENGLMTARLDVDRMFRAIPIEQEEYEKSLLEAKDRERKNPSTYISHNQMVKAMLAKEVGDGSH